MPIDDDYYFNAYLIRAVDEINANWAGSGYDISSAYTHDLHLGSTLLKATHPPWTMCVAAQMEIIVTALNLYIAETDDSTPTTFLPSQQWTSLRPGTLKDWVWVNSGSRGTADALSKFGMGVLTKFSELTPGSFINLNRVTGSGHATLFLGYLDEKGALMDKYGPSVAGFYYYSSQGKTNNGGFGYRYAFFDGTCPLLPEGYKRDCGIIKSDNQKYLNTGKMLMPTQWSEEQRDLALSSQPYKTLSENSINPAYLDQTTTDD